jgi:hypothetical protein
MGFPDGYNCELLLGEDNADNAQDTSLVTSNADGSVLERLEYLQTQVAALATGEVILQGVVDTAAPSTTNVKCAGLVGYQNDFFNNAFYMQVLRSGGAAPEPEVRLITDYVSTTGTFTTAAFSQNVESGDLILIIHESQVAIGRNDADNTFDSSTVAANADGSILERLEALKDQVTAVDDYVDGEITLIKTETDKIAATIVKIDAEIVKTTAIGQQVARTCVKSTCADVSTQNLFTVAGGAVRILAIVGHITTALEAKANATKLVYTSTGGAAVDLCATLNVTGSAIRKLLTITGVAANPLALSAAEGVVVSAVATAPIIVTPGALSLDCADTSTGVIDWYIEYEPLQTGATIVSA